MQTAYYSVDQVAQLTLPGGGEKLVVTSDNPNSEWHDIAVDPSGAYSLVVRTVDYHF